MEVIGRYVVHNGTTSGVPWTQICRLVGKDIRLDPAPSQWWPRNQSHRLYARNRLQSIDHALSSPNSATLPHRPTAPPASEISTASVNSVRRIRLRLDPSASRRAT